MNRVPVPKLLNAGGAPPLLLTTRIPAFASTKAEAAGTVNLQPLPSPTDSSAATAATAAPSGDSKSKVPVVRLLGIIKGGMPGTHRPAPGECHGCRTSGSLGRGETRCPPCRLTERLDALVGERKLAATAWENIRRTLCLPSEAASFSAKQARASFQLLDSFVKRFSFDDQAAMTRETVVTALVALPGLPPPFVKPLKSAAALAGLNNPKRKPISVHKFTEVAARQGSFCYWCGIRVVREAEIPAANRLARNHSSIVYLSAAGELREEAIGTIDHLVRVTDGGDNSVPNLVISCCSCNQERDQITTAYDRSFAWRRVPCGSCGGRFLHPDWGCCSICGAVPERIEKLPQWLERISRFLEAIKRIGKQLLS